MSWLSSFIGDITGANGMRDAANTQRDVADQNNEALLEMYYDAAGREQPFTTSGYNAQNEINALLGLPQVDVPEYGQPGGPVNQPSNYTGPDWQGYLTQNPDVMQYYQNNPSIHGTYSTPEEFAQYHYDSIGRQGDRVLPTFGGGSGGGSTTPGTVGVGGGAYQPGGNQNALATIGGDSSAGAPDMSQDAAYDRFLSGGFNRSMTDVTDNDMDQIVGALGAGGTSLSGSAQGALMDRLARNRNTAYGQHYNALAGISGAGQVSVGNQNQNGMYTTQSMNSNNQNAANALSSYQQGRGEANSQLLRNGIGAIAGFF